MGERILRLEHAEMITRKSHSWEGIHVYIRLIHVVVQQKLTQHCTFLNCVVCAEGLAGHLVILSVTSGGAAAQCRAAATPFSIAPGTTRSCVWAQGPGTSWGAAVAVGEGPPPGEGLAGKTGHACACLGASSRLRLWGQPGRAAVGQERAAQPEGHTAFQTVPQGASVWTCDAMNQPCVLLNVTEGGPRVWCSVPASRASAPAFGSLCVLVHLLGRQQPAP